jgi:His/Glu/Gln/Arg/opine family amino acid ABC transporter permease subunit
MNTLHFEQLLVPEFIDLFITGVKNTIIISVLSLILSFGIGLIVAFARNSNNKIISNIALVYIEFFRNTPALAQLFFWYYGLPEIGIDTEPMTTAIIGLGVCVGAGNAEVIRSGINAINRGILQASTALGYSKLQIIWYFTIPNALNIIFKPLSSNFINLVLSTSMAIAITVPELSGNAQVIIGLSSRAFEVYVIVLITYGFNTFILSFLTKALDYFLISKGYFKKESTLQRRTQKILGGRSNVRK